MNDNVWFVQHYSSNKSKQVTPDNLYLCSSRPTRHSSLPMSCPLGMRASAEVAFRYFHLKIPFGDFGDKWISLNWYGFDRKTPFTYRHQCIVVWARKMSRSVIILGIPLASLCGWSVGLKDSTNGKPICRLSDHPSTGYQKFIRKPIIR